MKKFFNTILVSCATLVIIFFSLFMTISLRIAVRIIFDELGILPFYLLYNALLAYFVSVAIYKNKNITRVNLAFTFIISLMS